MPHNNIMTPRGLSLTKRSLLAFGWDKDKAYWVTVPQVPFRPHGLSIFGAPDNSRVRAIIGNGHQLVASLHDIPAKWFSTFQTYEQIRDGLEKGLEPAAWGDWDTLNPGCWCRLWIESEDGTSLGPESKIELVMWGVSIENM